MKKLFWLLPLFAFTLFSCDEDTDDVVQASNIVQLASDTDDLSILVSALQQADLVSALEGEGPFTVFAPTNAAFQELLDSNSDWNSLSDIPTATLQTVLLFHVVEGNVKSTDLSDTYVKSLAKGPNDKEISLQIATTGGVMFNAAAMPVTVDVEASNGVVHIIDKVMLPPAVTNVAINNSNFSILVDALTDARHATTNPAVDYVSILSGTGPFTVFAPTNDAFIALLDSNPAWNGLADIPVETLQAVLNYHVLNGANVQSTELNNGQEIEMFSGGIVTVDLSSGAKLMTSSEQSANIIITDVQGANGVVHAIDSVLLP